MSLRYLDNVVTLEYDPAPCTGCGKCLEVCPHTIFTLGADGKAVMGDRDLCIECGACMRNCPFGTIKVRPGVGCAYAIMFSALRGKPAPVCGE
jgi:NAD-dependent dihydropyrimidine dehydrogenase PreA subunit